MLNPFSTAGDGGAWPLPWGAIFGGTASSEENREGHTFLKFYYFYIIFYFIIINLITLIFIIVLFNIPIISFEVFSAGRLSLRTN